MQKKLLLQFVLGLGKKSPVCLDYTGLEPKFKHMADIWMDLEPI